MKLLIIVLNKTEKLDELMVKFSQINVKGATIVHSTGMARALYGHDESPLIGSLRALLDPDKEENRTIFMAIRDEQLEGIRQALYEVVGDLSQPDTCVLFTLPIDFADGFKL